VFENLGLYGNKKGMTVLKSLFIATGVSALLFGALLSCGRGGSPSPPASQPNETPVANWSVDMKFPAGFSRGYVQATWTQ